LRNEIAPPPVRSKNWENIGEKNEN
jgi:hypothetical protein